MSGDRIIAIIAIVAMLILVVPGVARRGLPTQKIVKLVLVWAVIFLAVTALIMVLR